MFAFEELEQEESDGWWVDLGDCRTSLAAAYLDIPGWSSEHVPPFFFHSISFDRPLLSRCCLTWCFATLYMPLCKKNDIWICLENEVHRRELKLSNIARILSKFSLKVGPQTDNRKQKLRKQHQTPPLQRSPDLVENCFYCPFAWS